MMLTIAVGRMAIAYLCRPFVQRFITLVIATLLAMSLMSTSSILALPHSGCELASHVSSPPAATYGQIGVQATEQYNTGRRRG